MATEPNQIKIVFQHERTEGISERYPTTNTTYYISADEAEVMVERDLELRRRNTNAPELIERRSIDEIIDELGKQDYNNAKKHLRHTRYRSVTARDDVDRHLHRGGTPKLDSGLRSGSFRTVPKPV